MPPFSQLGRGSAEDGARAMDQQGPQVAITTFADAEETVSTATRSLLGHEAEPGGKLATVLEAASITDRSHQRRRAQWADAFDFAETLAYLATAVAFADPPIPGRDPAIELDQLNLQLANQTSDQVAELHSLLPPMSASLRRSWVILRAMTIPCSARTPRI